MNRPNDPKEKYTTLRVPSRQVIQKILSPKQTWWIENIEEVFIGSLAQRVQKAGVKGVQDHQFLSLLSHAWRKWALRYKAYYYGCLTEPMLLDYDANRMVGMTVGYLSEGVGLVSQLLGALHDQRSLHKKGWEAFIGAASEVVAGTLEGLGHIQDVANAYKRPRWRQENQELRLNEEYDLAKRTLESFRKNLNKWSSWHTYQAEQITEAIGSGSDLERCAMQAEQCSVHLEKQGVILPSFVQKGGEPREESLVTIDGETEIMLEICKDRIGRERRRVGLAPMVRPGQVIHEVARMFLACDAPYYPSPWREGRNIATTRRSHLNLDVEKLIEDVGIKTPSTLYDYLEKGRVLHPMGAPILAKIVLSSLRQQCYYRYYLVEVALEQSPTGKGFKLIVQSPDVAPPRGALDLKKVEEIAKKGGTEKAGKKSPAKKKSPGKKK
jgi:hypothetical protein